MLPDSMSQSIYSADYLMKRRIVLAANELCHDASLSSITVGRICDKAKISRQTFYKHFHSKEDLASWVVTVLTAEHFNRIGPKYSWKEAFVGIANAVLGKERVLLDSAIKIPESRDNETQVENIRMILLDIFRTRGIALTTVLERQINLFAVLYVSAFQSFAMNNHLNTLSPKEIGDLLAAFMPKELSEALQA